MPIPSMRVLELEKKVEKLEKRIDNIIKELKHIGNITIFEEDKDDKEV